MAKKIRDPGDTDKTDLYPWLRLLELEVQPPKHPTPRRGKGRPPNPFPRRPVHVTLTEDELDALDELARSLSAHFNSRMHRGHVIAFLTFYFHSRLQKGDVIDLPEEIISLSDLAHYLDLEKGV
jgi:hypothetical protein